MGIIDSAKNIKKYSDADKHILGLIERLLNFEERNMEELKKFLLRINMVL